MLLLVLASLISLSVEHAIFKEPPSRSSMGHFKPTCGIERNVDHQSVYCGGISTQHSAANMGKCGICGDAFDGADKPNQAGGRWASGILSRSYLPGQTINVEIKLVANHMGFFTFAICPHNDPSSSPNRDCFLNNPLLVNGDNKYFATAGRGLKTMQVTLPAGMTCSQCIFQYTYTNGNNWGLGPQSAEIATEDCLVTKGKLGCGKQETFRGCADICIGSNCPQGECAKIGSTGGGGNNGGTGGGVITPPTRPPAPGPTICTFAGIKQQYFSPAGDQYCQQTCAGKLQQVCFSFANTAFLCTCSATPRSQDYKTITINVPERNTIKDTPNPNI